MADSKAYFKCAWYLQANRHTAGYYIPNVLHVRLSYALNHALNRDLPTRQRHYDKVKLALDGSRLGFPVLAIVAEFTDGVVRLHKSPVTEDLFCKPRFGTEGRGIYERWALRRADNPSQGRYYVSTTGKQRTFDELCDDLRSLSRELPYVLQTCGSNHSFVTELSGSTALSSVRLATCFSPARGATILPFAVLKLATRNADVDNVAAGAVAYLIDISTGVLQRGITYKTEELFERHPTTGKRVVGLRVPYWAEATELCKRAHECVMPTYPSVGWDIAILPDGPAIIEANIQWAFIPTNSVPHLGASSYVEYMLEYLDQASGTT